MSYVAHTKPCFSFKKEEQGCRPADTSLDMLVPLKNKRSVGPISEGFSYLGLSHFLSAENYTVYDTFPILVGGPTLQAIWLERNHGIHYVRLQGITDPQKV